MSAWSKAKQSLTGSKKRGAMLLFLGGGIVAATTAFVIASRYYNERYMSPVASRHLEAIRKARPSEGGLRRYMEGVRRFKESRWISYLSPAQANQLNEVLARGNALLAEQEKLIRARQEEAARKAQAKAQEEEERRNPDFKASITNYFLDADPRTFGDRIAQVRDGVLTVADVKCKLSGEAGCSVGMSGGRPVFAKWWDPADGFVYSVATFGEQVKRGSYDPDKAENPYVALQQQRIDRMMSDWQKEKDNAAKNCRGLTGEAWTICAGAQTAN